MWQFSCTGPTVNVRTSIYFFGLTGFALTGIGSPAFAIRRRQNRWSTL